MKKSPIKGIEDALSTAIHPEINYSLLKLGMIKDISVKENKASIVLLLPFLEVPIKKDLIDLVRESVKKLNKNIKIKIEVAEMNEKEKENFMKMAREAWIK